MPRELQSYHCLKRRNIVIVIVKFKCCKQKQNVIFSRKNLKEKSTDLTRLKFSGKLFINHQLVCRCRQLKAAGKMHCTRFFNNMVKQIDNGLVYKTSHIFDIENLLGIDNLDEFVNSGSF